MHLSINLLPNQLSKNGRRKLSIFIYLTVIAFVFTVMIIGGFRLVYITYTLEQTSSALNIPLAYVYLILPLSGLLISYYKILDIRDALQTSPGTQNIET